MSVVDYKQEFDSANRRASEKILSLYGIPDKYIKVFPIKSVVKLDCVLSPYRSF